MVYGGLKPPERRTTVAQKVQVMLIDDLDGGEADETVTFGLDGSTYEIDLSRKNADKLRKAITKYVEAARKAPASRVGGRGRPKGPGVSRTSDKERSQAIRSWAKQAGKPVNERGRIPASIVAEYEAVNG
jgi:hypothetical protein